MKKMIGRTASSINLRSICHTSSLPIAWTQVTLADFSLGQAMSRSTV